MLTKKRQVHGGNFIVCFELRCSVLTVFKKSFVRFLSLILASIFCSCFLCECFGRGVCLRVVTFGSFRFGSAIFLRCRMSESFEVTIPQKTTGRNTCSLSAWIRHEVASYRIAIYGILSSGELSHHNLSHRLP